ncbi:MAG: hypothetical protein ISS15_05275 [Alphaproteobacteria bacterium]|nr:hypothetical protein [Alphaproteobacteria bacterium]MBL6939469.1 hypothetical protein [Alphaproteobacteria bacterium]MBL7097050.1 hypothetical protein [Alphaproteobacteria bacterium]
MTDPLTTLEVEAAGWVTKFLAWIIVAVLVIAIAIYGAYRLFGDGPRQAAAAANGQAVVNGATTQAGGAAANIIATEGGHETAAGQTTRQNHDIITHTPGAAVPISHDTAAAARRAICMRKSAADLTGCADVLAVHP